MIAKMPKAIYSHFIEKGQTQNNNKNIYMHINQKFRTFFDNRLIVIIMMMMTMIIIITIVNNNQNVGRYPMSWPPSQIKVAPSAKVP